MATIQKITPCFWFDKQAEEAAKYYTSIFPGSRIGRISRYGKEGFEVHHMPEGTVLTIEFTLDGQTFSALNGGPLFKFNESISFIVNCKDQEELDHYWDKLSEGGDPNAQQCGWLKDKFGVSWQIVPSILPSLLDDKARSGRVMTALLQMKKLDIKALEEA
jgi:predicted 3-demethylubiquinone-9 3-methyltransferase (glyoxalase superfamily)